MENQSKKLGELCFIRQCIKTGDDKQYVIKSEMLQDENWKKSLRGKSIQRFCTLEYDVFIKYGEWLARNWKNKSFYETNKIAIRETSNRIIATLDFEHRYFLSSLYSIYLKESVENTQDNLKYLLAIINSNLANYYIKLIALNLTVGAFSKIRTNQLAKLPIKDLIIYNNLFPNLKKELVSLVDTMLQLNKDLQNSTLPEQKEQLKARIEYTDKKIDRLVYQLYDLTEEEIMIVEGE